jgi:hypothetical protein
VSATISVFGVVSIVEVLVVLGVVSVTVAVPGVLSTVDVLTVDGSLSARSVPWQALDATSDKAMTTPHRELTQPERSCTVIDNVGGALPIAQAGLAARK